MDEFLILVLLGTLLSFLGVEKRLFDFLGFLKIRDLLQSVEVLTRLLVQLFVNVLDDEFDSRYDDELECVDSSVGDLDDLVEGDELSLQRGDFDEVGEEPLEALSALLNGLTTASQTQDCRIV